MTPVEITDHILNGKHREVANFIATSSGPSAGAMYALLIVQDLMAKRELTEEAIYDHVQELQSYVIDNVLVGVE